MFIYSDKNLISAKHSNNSKLKFIEECIFNWSSIEYLSLPASAKEIDNSCFRCVSYLDKIEISNKNEKFKLIDGNYIVKESDIGSGIFDIIIFVRRGLKSIYCAFEHCSLKDITFEGNSSLESIKVSAFSFIPCPKKISSSSIIEINRF